MHPPGPVYVFYSIFLFVSLQIILITPFDWFTVKKIPSHLSSVSLPIVIILSKICLKMTNNSSIN